MLHSVTLVLVSALLSSILTSVVIQWRRDLFATPVNDELSEYLINRSIIDINLLISASEFPSRQAFLQLYKSNLSRKEASKLCTDQVERPYLRLNALLTQILIHHREVANNHARIERVNSLLVSISQLFEQRINQGRNEP